MPVRSPSGTARACYSSAPGQTPSSDAACEQDPDRAALRLVVSRARQLASAVGRPAIRATAELCPIEEPRVIHQRRTADRKHVREEPDPADRAGAQQVAVRCGAGKRAAIMNLVHSARLNEHDPYVYPKDVLDRPPIQLPGRIVELLPHRWQSASARNRLRRPSSRWVGRTCLDQGCVALGSGLVDVDGDLHGGKSGANWCRANRAATRHGDP